MLGIELLVINCFQTASSREYKAKKSSAFQLYVNNKIQQLKESDHGEAFGDHIERLWASIPEANQADSATHLSDVIENLLNLTRSSAPMNERRSSKVTPVRMYRQSSSRRDFGDFSKQQSMRLSFGSPEPPRRDESNVAERPEDVESLKEKLDRANRAKVEVETDLNIAREYVKVANMNLEATNAERNKMRDELVQAENKIEQLEDRINELLRTTAAAMSFQKAASDAEIQSKYLAERMRELSVRLEEEEKKNEELNKSLQQASVREAILVQQYKELQEKNSGSAPISPAVLRAPRSTERTTTVSSVAETAK